MRINAALRTEPMRLNSALSIEDVRLNAALHATVQAGGSFALGHALTWDDQGRLAVEVAEDASLDNTLPITAAAVQTTLGNIGVLLKTI